MVPLFIQIHQEKYKLPIINFHALRHTSASLQISRGISVPDISRRLVHSDISTTQNIYSHAFNSGNQKIVNEFNNIFNTKEGWFHPSLFYKFVKFFSSEKTNSFISLFEAL